MRIPIRTLPKFDAKYVGELNAILIGFYRALNQGIEFGSVSSGPENISCDIKTFTAPATADIEFSISHNLGRVPNGYWVIRKAQVCNIYDGDTVDTNTELYLKCNAISASGTLIII